MIVAAITLGCLSFGGPAEARATDQLLGAQSHALWGSSSMADMERELQLLAEANAKVVRVDLSWSSLETDAKGSISSWYVDRMDAFLQKAQSRGIAVIATVWSTPCWASSAPENLRQGCSGAWWDRGVDRYPPRDAHDYADAVAWVAQRWGSRLAALEIWNEPNLVEQDFLKADDPAVEYAGLLKAAYPRAKAASPGLTVLGGALAFSDERFLERLYQLGAGGSFDGLSFHPYNEWRDPDDLWQPEWRKYTFLTGVPAMHQVLARHRDGHKRLWLTEFGFSSCGQGDRWCVSEQQQAEYTKDSLRIVRGWPYVKAATVYNLRNKGSNPRGREDQFGLVRRDFTPKPAYGAFKQALTRRGARIVILRRRRLRLRGRGIVKVPLRCVSRTGAGPCRGRLTVRRRRSAGSTRAGSGRFALRANETRYVRMRLSRGTRRALARSRRLRITARATTHATGRARRMFRLVRLR